MLKSSSKPGDCRVTGGLTFLALSNEGGAKILCLCHLSYMYLFYPSTHNIRIRSGMR